MGNTRNTGYLQNIVQYDANGNVILPSLIGTGTRMVIASSTGLLSTQSIPTISDLSGVPTSRTITINGTAYDLTANRSWSVGTVTSVAALTIGTSGTDITSTVANSTTTPVITLNIPDASASARGVVTTGAQTFAGAKTFASTVAIGHTSPYIPTTYSLDINGALLVKNTGKAANITLINSDPSTGGNNAFVVHTVGGTSGTSYVDIQGYYGSSIAGSTVIKLNAAGGNVLVGSLAGSGSRMVVADATGILSTQAIQTLGDLSGVPTSRTLTINGTTYDLSANRSWTINSMVYPSAGIALSTGTAWGTSITDNSANWNTAYGWGNHASAGYATTTYVGTAIANLVASAPAALDTLNELAAALGNDASFSTTISTALGNRLRIDINTQGLTATQQGYGRTNLGLGSLAILSSIGNSYITDLAWSKITGAPAFITSYTETDTLATVTGRGASTSTAVTFSGGASISNLLINGASAVAESSLALGAMGTAEGGQLTLNKATSYTYAAHIDVWNDSLRFLYGTNTATSGVAMSVNLSNRQLILPLYTTSTSFTGTAAGVLAFDSSGNILTIAVPGGAVSSVNAGTGVSVNQNTGAITVSIGQSVATSATPSFDQVITTNNGNGTNFRIGDDAWIGDINAANTFRVQGVQDATQGYIVFGNSNATALGRSGTGALTYGGNTIYHAGNLTNLNQLTNGPGYLTSITSSQVTTALGFTPYNSTNPSGYLTGITSSQVTTALGFTPYNATNPSGYITSSANISGYSAALGGYSGNTIYTILAPSGNINGPVIKVRYDGGTANRYIDIGSIDGNGVYYEGLKIYNGGTLTMNGYTVLHSNNYNSYSPTLTGGGASGNWGINVTGTSNNITAYTINQNLGTGNTPTFYQSRFSSRISVGDGNGTPYLNTGSPGIWLSYNGGSDIFMGAQSSTIWGVYLGAWQFTVNSSGNISATGTISASNFSGSHSGTSSGTNTGDQTNISGTAYNITQYTINQNLGTSNSPIFAGLYLKNTSSLVQAPYQSDHDFGTGAYVQTDIVVSSGEPWTCEITAFNYGGGRPTKITINGYNYGPGTYYAGYAIATGLTLTGITVFQNSSGYLCMYIPRQGYWNAYNVNWYVNYRTSSGNRVTSISDSAKPSGISYENAVNPTYSLDTSNSPYAYNMNQYVRTSDSVSFYRVDATNYGVGNAIYFGGGNYYLNWTNGRIYSNVSIETAGSFVGTGLTINTGGAGTWSPFVVTSTSLWGDGTTQYVTIGAGGAAGIMIFNPHIVWDSNQSFAGVKFGRSGGVSSGAYYVIGTGASDNFFITKNGSVASPQFNINSSGNATFSGSITSSAYYVTGSTNGGYIYSNDWGIKLANNNGYIQFGPANGSWSHIYSDKSFYFNQELYINGNRVHSDGYRPYADSAGSVSGLTLTSSANNLNPDNVTQNQLGYNTSISLFGQTDGGLYSSAYNSNWIHQIYGDFRTGQIAVRGKNSGTWQGWRIVLDSSNYSSYALSRGGDNTSSVIRFTTNNGGYSGSLSSASLQIYADSNNSAYLSFHKGGIYAVNMGLDADNVLRIGGWSASSNRWQLDMSGNETIAGNFNAGGTITSPTYLYANSVRIGDMWGGYGMYRNGGDMVFGTEGYNWVFSSQANTRAYFNSSNGNLWMQWGGWLSDLLAAKQNASGALNTSNYTSTLDSRYFYNRGFGAGYPSENANTMPENTSAFTYSNNAPLTGCIAYFGASGYGIQLNGNYNGDAFSIRSRNGDAGSFRPWKRLLTDYNYNDYSPTLTGGGASGTWGINITGNASYASSAGSAGSSSTTTAVNGSGYGSSQFTWYQSPNNLSPYSGSWASYLISNHGDGSNYYNQTIIMPFWGAPQYSRREGGTNRGPYTFWSTENYDPSHYGGNFTADGYIRVNGNSNLYLDYNYGCSVVGVYSSYRYQGVFAMGDAYKLAIDGSSTGSLYGLAWSHPNAGGQAGYLSNHGLIHMMYGTAFATISDNIWCRGDITAYSDARVKDNIEVIDNALEKVQSIRGVTYTRTDIEDTAKRHAGVIAQEVLEVLPEVVSQNKDNGHYSVSYGNMVGLLVEAIKEQQAQIEDLKKQIEYLVENK